MPSRNPYLSAEEAEKYTDPETGEVSQALLDLEHYLVTVGNYLNPDGSENPDPVPMAPPVGYNKQPTLVERIREMVREAALAQQLAAQGVETFEEADDFDIPDDPYREPDSPWEGEFEPVRSINQDILDAAAASKKKAARPGAPQAPAEQSPQGDTSPEGDPS